MSREDEDINDSQNTITSWRHLLLGIFRGSLASPERTRTGTAHVATAAVLRPTLPQSNSSKTSFATANSGPLLVARLVKVNDFADSDTSSSSIYTEEEIQSAESIYLIIQGYEDIYFRFDEDFDFLSGSDSFHDASEMKTETTIVKELPAKHKLPAKLRLPVKVMPTTQESLEELVPGSWQDKEVAMSKSGAASSQSPDKGSKKSSHSPEKSLQKSAHNLSHNLSHSPNKIPSKSPSKSSPKSSQRNSITPVPQIVSSRNLNATKRSSIPPELAYPEPNVTPTNRYPSVAGDDILAGLQETSTPMVHLHNDSIDVFSDRHSILTSPRPLVVGREHVPMLVGRLVSGLIVGGLFGGLVGGLTMNLRVSSPHGLARETASLSSGELLNKLDTSVRLSVLGYTRQHLTLGISAGLTAGLTAGLDSQSELPVMLYTVQDRDSHNTRWSVYEQERQNRLARPSVPAPTYPGLRSGSNSGRSVSLSSKSSGGPSDRRSSRSSGSIHLRHSPRFAAPSRLPEVGSGSSHYGSSHYSRSHESLDKAGRSLLDPKHNANPGNLANSGSNANSDNSGNSNSGSNSGNSGVSDSHNVTLPLHAESISSPGSLIMLSVATPSARNSAVPRQVTLASPAVVQDTLTKQEYHSAMYIDDDDKLEATYTQESELEQQLKLSRVSWTRWAGMMVMGVVAVPILFMIAFGFFDYGGHFDYSLPRRLDHEKSGDVLLRYFRKYTRLQKILSFALGVFWIVVVLAMIGVSFGYGISTGM